MAFPQGGGGGKAPGFTLNNAHALSKPYELSGEMTPEKTAQLDEMLQLLFNSMRFSASDISTLQTSVEEAGGGSGDVVGPSSATDGRIAEFDGATGKLLADSGKLTADVVTGPGSAGDDNIATFDGVTGKIIQDSGIDISTLSALTASYFVVQKTLTEAEIESPNTSPIQLVAGVAGSVIFPVWCMVKIAVSAGYGGSPTWFLKHALSTDAVSGTATPNLTTATTKYFALGPLTTRNFVTTDPRNSALQLSASGDPAVPASGVATGEVTLAYLLLPLT